MQKRPEMVFGQAARTALVTPQMSMMLAWCGLLRRPMSMTFKKRQKEMKRQEKQRAKAERREQKKFAKRAANEAQSAPTTPSPDSEQQPQSDNKQVVPPG
jgi:hypothetical protein